jgi:hypothetical protein
VKISKLLVFAFGICGLFGVAIWLVYSNARDAYRAQGFNEGSIAELTAIYERLNGMVVIEPCPRNPEDAGYKDLILVKADRIMISVGADKRAIFCKS